MAENQSRPIVLVIDDDVRQLRLFKLLLKNWYRVETAAQISDAVAILEDLQQARRLDQVRAILLDIMMPKVDGFAFLQTLRQEYPQIPVIMCSAVGQQEYVQRAFRLGAADYLAKPFRREALLKKLEEISGSEPPPPPPQDASAALPKES